MRIGPVAEWASPAWNGNPASVGNIIETSNVETSLAGVYPDHETTTRTTISHSTFSGQRWAAIGDYRDVGNTYRQQLRGIAAGAARVSKQHPTEFRP